MQSRHVFFVFALTMVPALSAQVTDVKPELVGPIVPNGAAPKRLSSQDGCSAD